MLPGYTEENVTINAQPNLNLKGTLAIPAGSQERYPALLLLSDAGEVDRNANHSRLQSNIFCDLAAVFAELGLITLRYDKRGIGESGGSYYDTGLWDLLDDAEKAFLFLKANPRVIVDQIFILGFGEGAVLASLLGTRHEVKGLILLAAVAAPYSDVIYSKQEKTLAEIRRLAGLRGFIYRLLKVASKLEYNFQAIHKLIMESDEDVVAYQGVTLNAKWLREHAAYDLRDALRKLSCPVLVISGANDLQAPAGEAEKIGQIVPGAQCHIIEELTHLLRKDAGRPSILTLNQDYRRQLQQALDSELVRAIGCWLQKIVK